MSQLHIILDRTDPLLEVFANGLQDGAYDPSSIEYVITLLQINYVVIDTLVDTQL